ncbi:MAG: glycosyltransferase [Firmicutes bacterium]|jgi:glycosyltransferase involved in cell wall biosynthesis|nr:glycosyltransferase [Bacillota bacterium]NBI62560.1 glycosyltransferase [Clostridiales bacterium]
MNEKITIIVPVYNVEDYLVRCVESILAQTYQNLQVILVDDGSTDASGDICDSFAQKDERVQVIHKINGGATSARKAGLAKAQGEYIGFVDGDDHIEPNMYEELLDYLIHTETDFVSSGCVIEVESKAYTICLPKAEQVILNFNQCATISKYVLGEEGFGMEACVLWSKLYKRNFITDCYEKVSDIVSYGEDVCCTCHCMFKSSKFAFKRKAYYHYTIRDDSLTCRDEGAVIFTKVSDLYRHLNDIFQQYGCLAQLKTDLDGFYIRYLLSLLKPWGAKQGTFYIPHYYYPSVNRVLGKKVVIYGAGYVGQDYYAQLCKYSSCEIVALADTYPEKYSLDYMEVQGLKDLDAVEFDIILIAVLDENIMNEIRNSLLAMGIPKYKITWETPKFVI